MVFIVSPWTSNVVCWLSVGRTCQTTLATCAVLLAGSHLEQRVSWCWWSWQRTPGLTAPSHSAAPLKTLPWKRNRRKPSVTLWQWDVFIHLNKEMPVLGAFVERLPFCGVAVVGLCTCWPKVERPELHCLHFLPILGQIEPTRTWRVVSVFHPWTASMFNNLV